MNQSYSNIAWVFWLSRTCLELQHETNLTELKMAAIKYDKTFVTL